MPNIDSLVELLRQKAYLEAGGGRRDPAESISQIFGNTGKGLVNFAEARNKNIESILMGEKADREAAAQASEMTPMRDIRYPANIGSTQFPGAAANPDAQDAQNAIIQKRADMGNVNLKQDSELASNELKRAQANYYASGQKGGGKIYINPTTREWSDIAKPGFIEVPSGTGATIAAGPTKEAEAERMRVEAEERKPPTEAQSTSAIYATRMGEADKILSPLTAYATNANPVAFQAQRIAPDIANPIKETEFQQYDQAARNFLNAVLRKESGAVISPTEFQEGRRQYFPMPGDSPEVVEQKRLNRQSAIKGISSAAGKALPSQPSGTPPRIGERKGNFRFKGGDPNKQENWVPVKK